jgi:hypothetical protein
MRKASKYIAILPDRAAPSQDALGRPALAWADHRSPDTAETAVAAWREALQARDASRLAFAMVWALGHGIRRDTAVLWMAAEVAARGAILHPAFAAVADAGRAAAEAEPERATALLATTAVRLVTALGQAVAESAQTTTSGEATADALLEAIATRNVGRSKAVAAQAHRAGLPVLDWLQVAAARHPGDAGVCAVAVVKLADLLAQLGQEDSEPLVAAVAAALAQRPEQSALAQGHQRRLTALAGRLQAVPAADPDKGKLFAEPKFRLHLLGPAEGALKAVLRAVEVGLPHAPIAGSLTLAAAERLLQLDPKWDKAEDTLEDRSDAEQVLVLCSAVRQLQRSVPAEEWLSLLLFATTAVAELAALELPASQRQPLPDPLAIHQTWDHGPEIAKIVTAFLARDGERSVAALRAYFLHVLPEQPLLDQLREVGLRDRFGDVWLQLSTANLLHAALDELAALGSHPHRELVLAAALRSAATQRHGRGANRVVESILSWQTSGWRPTATLGGGPL